MPCALLLPLALLAPPTVDWRNQTYAIDDRPITLKDGHYAREGDDVDNESLDLNSVGAADLDGDGRPEHVIGLQYWGGGTGRLDELHIYRVVDGKPMLAGRIPGGDRGDGGHALVKVEGDRVRVERMSALPWEGACCPRLVVVESWGWHAGKMTLDVERSRMSTMADDAPKKPIAPELAAARAAMQGEGRNPQTAIEHLANALESQPDDAAVLGELGFALMSENVAEAEPALWAAVNGKGPDKVKGAALYNLAKLYQGRGDRDRAIDAAQRSLVLRPDSAPTRALLAALTAAK